MRTDCFVLYCYCVQLYSLRATAQAFQDFGEVGQLTPRDLSSRVGKYDIADFYNITDDDMLYPRLTETV